MAVEHNDKKPPTGFFKWIQWTGFPDKTLWDWMQLLVVPIVLGGGAIWFQGQANSRAEESDDQRASVQRDIENDRAQQAAFQTYLAGIGTLLLDKNLSDPNDDTAVREIARANTLSTLRQLDPERKGLLIKFLYDSDLVGFTNRPSDRFQINDDPGDSDAADDFFITDEPLIIDLDGADLSGADLSGAFLEGIDLLGVKLTNAILTDVDLGRAVLSFADLNGANLRGSVLTGADLSFASLEFSDLTGATITNQELAMAEFFEGLTLPDGSRIGSNDEMIAFKKRYGGTE